MGKRDGWAVVIYTCHPGMCEIESGVSSQLPGVLHETLLQNNKNKIVKEKCDEQVVAVLPFRETLAVLK